MVRVNARLEARKTGTVDAPPLDANATPPPGDTDPDTPTDEGTKPPVDQRENDPAYWRQRFNVTQGMLRTQQATHREAIEEKDRVITELRDKVRTLEAGGSSSENEKPDVALIFSPEEIERFGQDQCEAMARAAIKAARQQAKALFDAEVKPLQDKAKESRTQAQETKEAEFWEKLAEHHPDWEDVNKTTDWQEWLAQDDPSSGLQRQDILDRHRGALNAIGVAKMFADFKKGKDRPTPPVAASRSAGGGGQDGPTNNAPAKGYPTPGESRDYFKRAKLNKVSDKERAEFEARLKLKAAA